MDVGKRITNLRATKGLSTTALAHKAGLAQMTRLKSPWRNSSPKRQRTV